MTTATLGRPTASRISELGAQDPQGGRTGGGVFPKAIQYQLHHAGNLKLDIDGGHVESITKVYDFMERMGIKTTAPTAEITEEFYLDQLAYVLNIGKKARQAL